MMRMQLSALGGGCEVAVLQGVAGETAEGQAGEGVAAVVGIQIEEIGVPVGGVDVAIVFYAVGTVDADGGVGTFGVAFAVATVVLLGIIVKGVAVFQKIDAVGGTGKEVRGGIGVAEGLIGRRGVLAVGFGKGKAVAQEDGHGQHFGLRPALDEILQHVEGADIACLEELEGVAADNDAVAQIGRGKGVVVQEVVVGVEGVGGMGLMHGHAAYSAQVVVEEGTAVAVA